MSEFNNRIDAQRRVLRAVNSTLQVKEELFGLSSGALERWANVNQIDRHDALLSLLYEVASKLFLLSNKSQEQITEDYRRVSNEIEKEIIKITEACSLAAALHPKGAE